VKQIKISDYYEGQ
jgi:hypothetical protein